MQRLISATIATTLIATLLIGCGGGGSSKKSTPTNTTTPTPEQVTPTPSNPNPANGVDLSAHPYIGSWKLEVSGCTSYLNLREDGRYDESDQAGYSSAGSYSAESIGNGVYQLTIQETATSGTDCEGDPATEISDYTAYVRVVNGLLETYMDAELTEPVDPAYAPVQSSSIELAPTPAPTTPTPTTPTPSMPTEPATPPYIGTWGLPDGMHCDYQYTLNPDGSMSESDSAGFQATGIYTAEPIEDGVYGIVVMVTSVSGTNCEGDSDFNTGFYDFYARISDDVFEFYSEADLSEQIGKLKRL